MAGEAHPPAPSDGTPRTAAGPFTVICDIDPRYRDTDGFGHINNAVYVSYMEVARQAYWKRLRPDEPYDEVPFIMAHIDCSFRSEATVGAVLEVGIRCTWIGDKSFAFAYEIRDKQTRRLVVEAQTVQVCYDYDAKQSISMPAALRRDTEALEGRSLMRPARA